MNHESCIRLANAKDVPAIVEIYKAIHTQEEAGEVSIGWDRAIYPTHKTAETAVAAGEMYVELAPCVSAASNLPQASDAEGVRERVVAAGILNHVQPPGYEKAAWTCAAQGEEVFVLHTLVVDPAYEGHGYAREFVKFYEGLAREQGCIACRIDTNSRNTRARAMYAKLGYTEVGIVPVTFNGLPNVQLVCLEKNL